MQTTIAKPQATDPLDFLAIDALLSDEERAIRDTVRTWVRERILPEIAEWFEQGILPRELTAMPWSLAHARTSPLRYRPADVRAVRRAGPRLAFRVCSINGVSFLRKARAFLALRSIS